jgi:Zn-dependent protease with chaperone function
VLQSNQVSGQTLTFVGHATHPSLGEEIADGTIALSAWQLRFEGPRAVLEIPLKRLQLETGESGEVVMTDPSLPDWVVYTLDARILQHQALLRQSHTRSQIKALRDQGDLSRRLKITGWCLGGFATLAAVIWMLMGIVVSALVARVPPQWEQQMGNDQIAELKQIETFIQDPKLLAKLDRAVKPLVDSLPTNQFQYQFYLVDDHLPNAFALPGGHVVVTIGLLEIADKPEEIAGAVAHEIAHVNLKHHIREQLTALGPLLMFNLFLHSKNQVLGALGGSSQLLIKQSFSQEYELEADAKAWEYLNIAHINPRGCIELLGKFKLEEDRMKRFGVSEVQAFSSHPGCEKRIKRLEQKWKKVKDRTDFVDLGSWN